MANNDSIDNITLSTAELFRDNIPLRFANFLEHHLFCRLSRYPPKIINFQIGPDFVTDFSFRIRHQRFGQGNLFCRVLYLLDDSTDLKNLDLTCPRVDFDLKIVPSTVSLSCCGQQGRLKSHDKGLL